MTNIPEIYHGKPLIHAWDYCTKDGAPFGVVGRYQDVDGKKDIVPFFKRNGTNWTPGIELNPRPLFGMDMLANHSKGKAVFIVEGEKSAAAMQSIGIAAVTSLGGSQAAKLADWTSLNGFKMVYLLPDKDEPGEHYIKDVYRALIALTEPPQIKLLRLEGLPDKGDIVDWLQSWVNDWDGYAPIPKALHKALKDELKTEIQKAEPIPKEWGLDTLDSGACSAFKWENPGKIETDTLPVQALQTELIPEPFRAWLADVSHRMQTPGDFAAVSSLVIVGSLIGAGCSIKPKRLDDWEVIPNLWGACIGRPSVVLKTPSMKEPMRVLERLQAEYGELFEKDKAGAEFDGLTNKAMIDAVKGQLSTTAKGAGKDKVVNSDDIQKLKADYLDLTQSCY